MNTKNSRPGNPWKNRNLPWADYPMLCCLDATAREMGSAIDPRFSARHQHGAPLPDGSASQGPHGTSHTGPAQTRSQHVIYGRDEQHLHHDRN